MTTDSRIRVGPAGWSYSDWKGIVYPQRAGRDFDPLLRIASMFELVEINVSFYRAVDPRIAEHWVSRVEATDLHFTAKAPQALTHRTDPIEAPVVRAFTEFLEPLERAGRLDAVLAQFPWSFRPSVAAMERMAEIRQQLTQWPLVFELRHGDWQEPRWVESLERAEFNVATIDQPQVGHAVDDQFGSGPIHYLRLHGRNREHWFDRQAGRDERYDYLYSIEEIQRFTRRLQESTQEGSIRIITNNHFEGQAVVNALEIKALLGRPAREVPSTLRQRFPDLEQRWARIGYRPRFIAKQEGTPGPTQGELFG